MIGICTCSRCRAERAKWGNVSLPVYNTKSLSLFGKVTK